MVATAQVVVRLAIAARDAFLRSGAAPDGARLFRWHWVPLGERAHVRLASPVLLRTLKGVQIERQPGAKAHIHQAAVEVVPNWQISGGNVERDQPTETRRMVARVGWNETYQVAVLFYADGGSLPGVFQ